MASWLKPCSVCASSKRRVCRLLPAERLLICEECVRQRVIALCEAHVDKDVPSDVLTDGLTHVAVLLARLSRRPASVGDYDILLAIARMSNALAAMMPEIANESRPPLQIEIDRLDRIAALLATRLEAVTRVELVLQITTLFRSFGVSLDNILDQVEGGKVEPS